jgi:hypothetical protein
VQIGLRLGSRLAKHFLSPHSVVHLYIELFRILGIGQHSHQSWMVTFSRSAPGQPIHNTAAWLS